MFEVTYPVIVKKPFENITFSAIDNYKTGDIFDYNPQNTIHISLMDAGFFEKIDNSKCVYIANKNLELDKEYEYGDFIPYESIPEYLFKDFILAGFIQQTYKKEIKEKDSKSKKVQVKKAKKITKNSYSKIAKELNLTPKKFKTLYLEKFGKEIKDMKHTVSKPTEKKIIEALT